MKRKISEKRNAEKKNRRQEEHAEQSKNFFQNAGLLLAQRAGLDRPGEKNRDLCRELTALASGDPKAIKKYYGKKIADTFLVLLIFAGFTLLLFLMETGDRETAKEYQLQRPEYGEGDRKEELMASIEGESEFLEVTVQARKYTEEQAAKLLEKSRDYLDRELKGDNTTLDEVRSSLRFPASLEDGAVKISWMTLPYGILGEDGTIQGEPEKDGSLIEIQATLTCQGQELIYETAACVYPPALTKQEQLWKTLREKLAAADEESAQQDTLLLPKQVEGREVFWSYPTESVWPLSLLLTLILPICLFIGRDQKVHEQAQKREMQLRMDYPELMWKLTMLLGAGVTIRGAFIRIAADYQRENRREVRFIYEEVKNTCYEMKSGISEGTAYENFGKRCGLPRFIKLGSLLEQNLKKGSRGLAALLQKEAVSSMEERKNLARKLGEQAGSRMLFPMMMMLGVVLIILVIPAFLSF